MDPRFASYAISSHWPYLDAHLELTRSPAVRRALWLLAQLQVEVEGAPVLLGQSRLRDLDLTRGEAEHVGATLADLERRHVLVRFPGGGRRPAAWAFRAPLDHWRRVGWRAQGARALAEIVFGCARSRFCEGRCDFVKEMPGQTVHSARALVLGTPAHLFPSGQTLVDFRRKVAPPFTKSRGPVDFVPSDPVDFLRETTQLAPPSPSSSFSSIEENSLSLSTEDRQDRIDVLQGGLRAACGSVIFQGSKRWAELLDLAGALSIEQCHAVAREIASTNDRREHKLGAPLLLDRARELAKSPAIRFLVDVAPEG